jgi:hypothetical protein
VDKGTVTFLSEDEASGISGSGIGCWISTAGAVLSFSLMSYDWYTISTLGMAFYCR